MKKLTHILISTLVFVLFSTVSAQTPRVFWIKAFSPGSSDLNDPRVDKAALAMLDELMQDLKIEVTFLGAADNKSWKMKGEYVHKDISEAWNDAKSLSRARTLRARYGRGNVGITHESIAGVKVIWTKNENYITKLNQLEKENEHLRHEISEVKSDLKDLAHEAGTNGKNGHTTSESSLNVSLQAGFWTWQTGSNSGILSPYLASSITIRNASFHIRGGVTPWHTSTRQGNKSESFIYFGARYLKSDNFGFTLGVYRGWEFFTTTDDWLFKTTGISAGIAINKGIIELNPALTFSNLSSLDYESKWRFGVTLGIGLNIKNILSK